MRPACSTRQLTAPAHCCVVLELLVRVSLPFRLLSPIDRVPSPFVIVVVAAVVVCLWPLDPFQHVFNFPLDG